MKPKPKQIRSRAQHQAINKARKQTARCTSCGGFTAKDESQCLRCAIAEADTAEKALKIWKRLRTKLVAKQNRELRTGKRKTWPLAA